MIQASVNEYLLNKVDGFTKVVNQLKVITEQQNREIDDMKKQIEDMNKWIKEHFEYSWYFEGGNVYGKLSAKNVEPKCEHQ